MVQDLNSLPGGGTLCVRPSGGATKTRTYVVARGFGPDHTLGVYNNNIATIERAFIERYFLCKEGGSFRPALGSHFSEYSTEQLKSFRQSVMSHMPHLPVLTEAAVVSFYTGAKRQLYERARISLLRTGLQDKDAELTSFVKFEKQDVQKAPRVINPRHPRYNLSLGKYLKHAEKPFFRAINEAYGAHTKATVIKGFNSRDSATILKQKWDRFPNPVAVGLDASKFDMHVSVPALRYEHSFYRSLFPGSGELSYLLDRQLVNKGRAYASDGKVTFEMKGTRSSGDLNTSLGNCIIMCSLVYAYAAEHNIPLELANNGDDCVVFLDQSHLATFSQGLDTWFRKKGFAMTVEPPAFEFEEIEFCQTHPIRTGNGWLMVRNHHAVLTKDPMCLVPVPTHTTYLKWLYAVGECGTNATDGVPVQSHFYQALLRHGVPCSQGFKDTIFRNTGWQQRADGLANNRTVVTDASRASYYAAFGVLPDVQCRIEEYFDTATFAQLQSIIVEREDLPMESGLSLLLYPHNDTK
uniref:RNA-directed RNA polymerase n=1 Tax=Riboviria sp. TaxID=2585031 RepID=A0A893A4K5_9VIRU|nr:MAG: hypothetical protein 1 [Riboviria sp.]